MKSFLNFDNNKLENHQLSNGIILESRIPSWFFRTEPNAKSLDTVQAWHLSMLDALSAREAHNPS